MVNASMTRVSSFCLDAAIAAITDGVGDDRVRVEPVPSLHDGRLELKVNWLSIGECSPAEAATLAGAILRAAALAEVSPVNGAKVVFAASK